MTKDKILIILPKVFGWKSQSSLYATVGDDSLDFRGFCRDLGRLAKEGLIETRVKGLSKQYRSRTGQVAPKGGTR